MSNANNVHLNDHFYLWEYIYICICIRMKGMDKRVEINWR